MSLVSSEELEQEEELIEAVGALVETAAVSVWSGIVSDLEQFLRQSRQTMETLFPVLVDYQHDNERMRQDLEKLAISTALFLVAMAVLAPFQRKTRGKRVWFGRTESYTSLNTPKDEEDSSTAYYDDETDEERFEKMYTTISMSRYRKLVLPPTCRHVEKNNERKQREVKKNNSNNNNDTNNNEQKKTHTIQTHDVDENPAIRLQTYCRHILHFVRSIFTYDYAGAGWTLILWLQGIRKYRRTVSEQSMEDEPEEDDASLASSKIASIPAVQRSKSDSFFDRKSTLENVLADEHTRRTLVRHGSANTYDAIPSNHQEEKKEAQGGSPRPDSLREKTRRETSESSIYFESSHAEEDSDSVSSLPVIALHNHKSNLKRRDALASYRSNPELRLNFATSSSSDRPSSAPSTPLAMRVANAGSEKEQALQRTRDQQSQKFFFETANSRDTLKKFSVEIAVPDNNGYILGDEFLPDSRYTPLLVFVNARSGPQQGQLLITQLRRLLNPIQVWDLARGPPEPVLQSFCVLTRLRILVCGGDGTVSWIISALERLKLQRKWPPIGILPLGTGNDLARIHGWGGGYNNESLTLILEQISESYISLLDRWDVTIQEKGKKKTEKKSFFNYLGVGADAQAALQVHYLRESRPDWFFSRIVNKAWYGVFGAEDLIKASCVNLRKDVTLFADGVEIPLPADSQGIIVLNIDSYAGGVPLWSHGVKYEAVASPLVSALDLRRTKSMGSFPKRNRSQSYERVDSVDDLQSLVLDDEDRFDHVTACDLPSSCQDGILEIVSIRGAFHLGQIKVGLSNAQRLCQCREVTIKIKKKVAVHVDGEPWRQSTSVLHIERKKDPAIMLHRSSDDGGVETEMSKLLDWAEERKLIDSQVHTILMKEFSRRIESKTRQRRVRNHENLLFNLKRAMGSSGAVASMYSSQHNGGIAF